MTESSSVLSEEFCRAQPQVFGAKHDLFAENGGWKRHLEILSRPMVLSLSIADNVGIFSLSLSLLAYIPIYLPTLPTYLVPYLGTYLGR